VITEFQRPFGEDNKGSVVMLISLKSGAVGLNLTAASNVFLVSGRHGAPEASPDDSSAILGGSLPLRRK
jgi:hypothetical protein